jgi:hypothetical protein
VTFKDLQDRVMGRLNLTSVESRARVKTFLNERYRKLQTTVGLGRVRFGTLALNTINGTFTYSPATLAKPITIMYPAGNRVLTQKSMDELRMIDPDSSMTGEPEAFCLQKFGATTCTLYLWPKPNAIYALSIDGILTGTDLVNDNDVPVLPEDFHDTLEFGAAADELLKMEKPQLAAAMETKEQARTKDLRYFMAKSTYLGLQQGSASDLFWWWGPWWWGYQG